MLFHASLPLDTHITRLDDILPPCTHWHVWVFRQCHVTQRGECINNKSAQTDLELIWRGRKVCQNIVVYCGAVFALISTANALYYVLDSMVGLSLQNIVKNNYLLKILRLSDIWLFITVYCLLNIFTIQCCIWAGLESSRHTFEFCSCTSFFCVQ